jgi:hypothetical protein
MEIRLKTTLFLFILGRLAYFGPLVVKTIRYTYPMAIWSPIGSYERGIDLAVLQAR